MTNPFTNPIKKSATKYNLYDDFERGLANRNSGTLLETISLDITPLGAHYLLTHFDIPILDASKHLIKFNGAFENPFELNLKEIRALPKTTLPVTLECSGNGRAGLTPRKSSMPWKFEAVGTSEWTGTPLAPIIAKARPSLKVKEISFTGADYGFANKVGHYFGRSLKLDEIEMLDVLLVYEMNGLPLLPQHGAPIRIIVPGWYGMASVKWLETITALEEPYDGFQQIQTYQYKRTAHEEGLPITEIKVKSLMVPPGVPDWFTRERLLTSGAVHVQGRAWSGAGRKITKVEFGVDGNWQEANLIGRIGKYAWTKWEHIWHADVGEHVIQCRATDEIGASQPLDPPWDLSGFGNNAVHSVRVLVQ